MAKLTKNMREYLEAACTLGGHLTADPSDPSFTRTMQALKRHGFMEYVLKHGYTPALWRITLSGRQAII